MSKTTSQLVGTQEVAELLGVATNLIATWYRRGKLPEPRAALACGPVWEKNQFPAAVRRELVGDGRSPKSSTSPRNGKRRKTSRSKAA